MALDSLYQKQYYLSHRETKMLYQKQYYKDNIENCRYKARMYGRSHKEQSKKRYFVWQTMNAQAHVLYTEEWRKKNPLKAVKNSRQYVINRRARLKRALGIFDFDKWMQKVLYYGWRCFYCRIELDMDTVTVDHRKPLSKGGSNWLSNLVPACRFCNSKKGNSYERRTCKN